MSAPLVQPNTSRQRLEDEYSSNVIITAPTVPYKVVYQRGKQTVEELISNPAEFPDTTDTRLRVAYVEEPMVNATIFVPTGEAPCQSGKS